MRSRYYFLEIFGHCKNASMISNQIVKILCLLDAKNLKRRTLLCQNLEKMLLNTWPCENGGTIK